MGEMHFADVNNYTSQGLDFDKIIFTGDYSPQILGSMSDLLNNCTIEFKEVCRGADYFNPCCNIEFTIYDYRYKKLGKFIGHTEREDRFYKYEGNKETNQFESIKEYTVVLSDFFEIS